MDFIKNSIGLKIFAIISLIVFLMVGITFMNLRVQSQVGDALDRVSNRYILAYGALARANVRSLEQAMYLRGLIVKKFLLQIDVSAQEIDEELEKNGEKFQEEMALAHTNIAYELTEKDLFADTATMARIDERVTEAERQQARYEEKITMYKKLLLADDWPSIAKQLGGQEEWRNDFNEHLDTTRRMMLQATKDAAADSIRIQKRAMYISLAAVLLASVLALIVAWFITRSLVRPVHTLLEGTKSVIGGSLDVTLPITTTDEIGHLTQSFNCMTEELRTGSRVRDMFGKYMDPRIVEDLIDKPQLLSVAGGRQTMTILFCDMKGFTSISEGLTPACLVNLLNRYFTLISEAVHENGGVIDKFIGDAVMAYWGRPFNSETDQARLAISAVLTMKEKIARLQSELPELLGIRINLPQIVVRSGIATGEVVVGNIGSEKTKNFTVIGDTVNLASRLEGVNKIYGTILLVTEDTLAMAADVFEAREVDTIVVPGKTEAKKIFEILAHKGQLSTDMLSLINQYAKGLAAYRDRQWSEARVAFDACLQITPVDGPSLTMLSRLDSYQMSPPADNWDGAWLIAHK
jgi:adenylate cyclase